MRDGIDNPITDFYAEKQSYYVYQNYVKTATGKYVRRRFLQ